MQRKKYTFIKFNKEGKKRMKKKYNETSIRTTLDLGTQDINNIVSTLKGKQLKLFYSIYNVKRLPLESDNQLRKRIILHIQKHKPGFLNREEYELLKKSTYYQFWKLNKCLRQLKNTIKQEIKKSIREIKNVIKRS